MSCINERHSFGSALFNAQLNQKRHQKGHFQKVGLNASASGKFLLGPIFGEGFVCSFLKRRRETHEGKTVQQANEYRGLHHLAKTIYGCSFNSPQSFVGAIMEHFTITT